MILAGDIGGTKCNLALYEFHDQSYQQITKHRYESRDFASFEQVIRKFLLDASHTPGSGSPQIEAAGFGVAVGYQYMTTSRQRQNILVCLFLPKTQATVRSRVNAMTATEMAKAEDDVVLKGALHGC